MAFSGETWGKVKKRLLPIEQKIDNIETCIQEKQTLPTTHDNLKLYKLPNQEALWWWNGSEYVEITNESGMVVCTALPMFDISTRLLYKLTQNMWHTGSTQFHYMSKTYSESSTPIEGSITHNTTTDKWYNGTSEITVNSVSSLPEIIATNVNKWYVVNGSLYRLESYNPVIIDYYAGVYCNIDGKWQALYTSNLAVDYNDIKEESLPTIQGEEVKGHKSITDYGGLTEELAAAIFQKKTMTNPIKGYIATTIEATLAEMDAKYSTAVRIKGDVNYHDMLPTNASAGDMYVVKYLYAYYNSTTDITIGILDNKVSTEGYVSGTTDSNLEPITWSGDDVIYNGNTYTRNATRDMNFNNQFCWNGVSWFKYGSADIDMSPYLKQEDVTNKFIIANPSITFGSSTKVMKNDNYVLYRFDVTLGTPITDIQSPDRVLMTAPSDVQMKDGYVNLMIKTHSGQFTAMENVPELPSGGNRDFLKNSIDPAYLKNFYTMSEIRAVVDKTHIGEGMEYDETTGKYYLNGIEITVNTVATIPAADADNEGNYYRPQGDRYSKVYLSEHVFGVLQDYHQVTGELLYTDKMPQIITKYNATVLSDGSSAEIWVLDTDNMSGVSQNGIPSWIVGYETSETHGILPSKNVNVPIYRCKKITLSSSSEYIEAVKRKRSGLNINPSGVYGKYVTVESEESKRYSSHGQVEDKCHEGFNGTWSFVPANNVSVWQPATKAYWSNNKLYVSGGITIDAFAIVGVG